MPTIPYIPTARPVKPKTRRKRKPWQEKTREQKQAKRANYAANRRRDRALFGEKGYVAPEVARLDFAGQAEMENQSGNVAQAIEITGRLYYRDGATPEERRQAEEALPHLLEAAKREFPLRRRLRRQAFQQPPSDSKNPVDK